MADPTWLELLHRRVCDRVPQAWMRELLLSQCRLEVDQAAGWPVFRLSGAIPRGPACAPVVGHQYKLALSRVLAELSSGAAMQIDLVKDWSAEPRYR